MSELNSPRSLLLLGRVLGEFLLVDLQAVHRVDDVLGDVVGQHGRPGRLAVRPVAPHVLRQARLALLQVDDVLLRHACLLDEQFESLVAQPLDVGDREIRRHQRSIVLRGRLPGFLGLLLRGHRLAREFPGDHAHDPAGLVECLDVRVHAFRRDVLAEVGSALRVPAAIDLFLVHRARLRLLLFRRGNRRRRGDRGREDHRHPRQEPCSLWTRAHGLDSALQGPQHLS